ncbi:MAG: EamA family transporter [Euryarchaeota archaeon]|jgi:drug/metabolite transporter (DMT)-like permease|nr:EamA family transporter [Euryarchaeota archaeon]MBT3757949.1 EamA family transporter [Euryarchaeota archaeon]MBT4050666.1 EamA family transporter [Euryarchaeota archaeon]MBT4347074.1 EamA family transporter [Euryarchaeota archaeon]MBT4650798.1 EamA family transporter [Euryarchaeota archaeon]|tara:strand:- start:923 stop:1909 length:987 start_codon:yes stop_codon:yes gene_type:complete
MVADDESTPLFAWIILGVGIIAVSSAGAVFQEMSEVPPILRSMWRLCGTSIILLPGFIYQYRNFNISNNSIKKFDLQIVLISSIFLAAHFATWVWSLDHTSLVHSLLFVTSNPLIVVIFMPILGTAVRRGHVMGALIGFTGAALTLIDIESGGEVTLIGDFAAFLGAVTVVGYMFAGRYLRSTRKFPIFVYAFPVTFLATIWLVPITIILEGSSFTNVLPNMAIFGWTDLAWLPFIVYLSIGPGLLGHTGINTAFRWISPIVVSTLLLFEPVAGALIGYFLTGEMILGFWTLIGGIMMIAGAFLVKIEEAAGEFVESDKAENTEQSVS